MQNTSHTTQQNRQQWRPQQKRYQWVLKQDKESALQTPHMPSQDTTQQRPQQKPLHRVPCRYPQKPGVQVQTYTFYGSQGYSPCSVEVIATSEQEAREIALASVDGHNGYWPKNGQTGKSLPVEENTGCYCASVKDFDKKVFSDPRQDMKYSANLTFEEWIGVVECKVKPFNPYVVRVYSCLDG